MGSNGRRWLVTGAGGQLGRSFLAIARRRGLSAVGCDRASLDVADAAQIEARLDEHRPDVVLNCAACTRVDDCEADPVLAERVNAIGPALLARACKGRALLVHMSTEYVFSGSDPIPIPEEAEPAPTSVYGTTKLAGEDAVRRSGCEHLIARTQWLFGPGSNFVRTILEAAATRKELCVVEDQIGRPTWTGALAPALLRTVEIGACGTIHLACEGTASRYDFACAIIAAGTRRGSIPAVRVRAVATAEVPRPAARPAYAVLGLRRARELGIELPHWQDALSDYLDAERENRDA
jgi:dTDP-4-dehydrorhamnose reductase